MGKLIYSMITSVDGYDFAVELLDEHHFANGVVYLRYGAT
jgi:hypothetical protein